MLIKIFKNKKNNQLFVSLPRRKFKGNEDPEFLDISKNNLIYKKKKRLLKL